MNTEKINEEADRYFEKCIDERSPSYDFHSDTDFKAGISFAASNPEVIGCITLEEAMDFAEWCSLEGYEFISYSINGENKKEWFKSDWKIDKTTSDLFKIFKQQKNA